MIEHLNSYGLTINQEKCQFGKNEIPFLGHKIGKGYIKPALDKLKAIRDFRSSKSASELRSFLGLVTYMGKFIPNLSIELDHLQCTARSVPFMWSATDE